MRQLLSRLWNDETAAVLAVDCVFVATVLVISSACGLVAWRIAVMHKVDGFAEAMHAICTSAHVDRGHGDDDRGHDFNGERTQD